MEESDFYGIGGMTETVCLDHFTDQVLCDALAGRANSFECSFCDREAVAGEPPFAVEMDELGTLVWDVLTWSYDWTDDPGDPWRDYEIYDNTYVMYETVEEAVDPTYAMQIVECLIGATSSTDAWVPSDSTDPSALGWSAYAATVRTESRFVVIGESKRPGYAEEPPARIGKFLASLLAYVESDLLIDLPADSTLYRGRMTDIARRLLEEEVRNEPSTALGSSPPTLAGDNRLSPPGISLFYSSDNLYVAVAEIALHSKYDEAVVGAFKTTKALRLLDFTRPLTKLPSIFATDEESRRRWMFARFKKHFTDMITAPVVLDGRENIDYTPTQVVAEWLRWVPELRIDGIAWPSHLAKNTKADNSSGTAAGAAASESPGRNVALFFGHGPDFQTDPPTAAELARPGERTPSLTLSVSDITLHRVSRAVTVGELPMVAEDDPDPLFLDVPSSDGGNP